MTKSFEVDLSSEDEAVVLKTLYRMSSEERETPLNAATLDLAPALVGSSNEDIAWRAIFFFGLVQPTGTICDSLVEAVQRWHTEAPYVALAAMDAIARLLQASVIPPSRMAEILASLQTVFGVDDSRLSRLSRLAALAEGRMSYSEYRDAEL